MPPTVERADVSSGSRWTARILGGLVVLFLLFDGVVKLLALPAAVEATTRLGYPGTLVRGLGILELACLAVYVAPPTAALGAILLTGYLGGAVATHIRAGSPLATHALFPIYLGVLVWGALFLRDRRLRTLLWPRP